MSKQAILQAIPNAISLQVLASGVMRYVNQDGQIVDLFGQVVAHANRSALQVTAKAQTTTAICGLHGLNSLSSADLTLCLGNKLKVQLSTVGSTLFNLTWREKVTALGLRVSLLRASVRRTSDTDCTSWRSPQRSDGEGGVMEIRPGTAGKYKLRDEAHLASWPTTSTRDHKGGYGGGAYEERQDQHGHVGRNCTTGFWANADWIDCKDGKTRPVEPSTFPLAYGATARVGRLRAYGNAIVPQVAQAFIGAYLECN
tara:strand:- start:441 stop:1208 length:768 start_codon:yes stop_codon:yes gene_type:complete